MSTREYLELSKLLLRCGFVADAPAGLAFTHAVSGSTIVLDDSANTFLLHEADGGHEVVDEIQGPGRTWSGGLEAALANYRQRGSR